MGDAFNDNEVALLCCSDCRLVFVRGDVYLYHSLAFRIVAALGDGCGYLLSITS